jgi:hypothetical protein
MVSGNKEMVSRCSTLKFEESANATAGGDCAKGEANDVEAGDVSPAYRNLLLYRLVNTKTSLRMVRA